MISMEKIFNHDTMKLETLAVNSFVFLCSENQFQVEMKLLIGM